jgi:hypothetical protein
MVLHRSVETAGVLRNYDFPEHAFGVDDISTSNQWRHNFAEGGGITVKWVAESIAASSSDQEANHRVKERARRRQTGRIRPLISDSGR